ncbi:MAG TPA: HipA domain-containing protein [Iamia sp.]|nr:HipA domain-containing protein [Iamia sp.]
MDGAPAEVAYVWVWLPGADTPVPAGRLDSDGRRILFSYGRRYVDRPDSISLYGPELPLRRGEIPPLSGEIAGCIADAGPDAWGRRVIEHRRTGAATDFGLLDYLLQSGSDRIGALDVQASPADYTPRGIDASSLDDLLRAAEAVDEGRPLPPALDQALLHGSSVGGARPKALLHDGPRRLIAKFPSSTDSYPVVRGEFVAMELARRAGLDVAGVSLVRALDRHALLVERFDRTPAGHRRALVSALTILELHDADGMAGRYATYVDLAHHIVAGFTEPTDSLRELFARLIFNILVGNTDDHARNHAAFWDGVALTLTPAYDIVPQLRTGDVAAQAMAYGPDGERRSQVARAIDAAPGYRLDRAEAQAIVDAQVAVIRGDWDEVCDQAELTAAEREQLWGRQVLNAYSLEGHRPS